MAITEAPAIPNARQERSIIPRITADMNSHLIGTTHATLSGLCDLFELNARSIDKKLRGTNWTDARREFALNQAKGEFEKLTQDTVDTTTLHTQAHIAQLEHEVAQVPEPNWIIASQIWKKLDAMSESELDAFLARTGDPQVVAAVTHAPTAFTYGSEGARKLMMQNYARERFPEKLALLNDARQFVEAVQNFRDLLVRKFRDEIR